MTEKELAEPLFMAFKPCGCRNGYAADTPGYRREAGYWAIKWLRDGLTVRRMTRAQEQITPDTCAEHANPVSE